MIICPTSLVCNVRVNFTDDTIAAVSTPAGQGGIGIVRMSGLGAIAIASKIFKSSPREKTVAGAKTFSLIYGHVVDGSGKVLDEAIVSVMRGPRSYTREDVVEINCHGGMVVMRKVLELMISEGARLAEPGEFTKRAFLNGRISLAQAEAVLDLISARTEEGMRIAAEQLKGGLSERLAEIRGSLLEDCAFVEAHIDFPEEDIGTRTKGEITGRLEKTIEELKRICRTFDEARFFRDGLSVAIVGRPNVGKSSLLNGLLLKDRAIVNELPGTTRDIIEEQISVKGLPVIIVDTAGIRHSEEVVEKEGIRRSIDAMEKADFVITVLDGSMPFQTADIEILERIKDKNALIAVNKSDLPLVISSGKLSPFNKPCLFISATTGQGLEELKDVVYEANLRDWRKEREGVVVTNLRHRTALEQAASGIERAAGVISREEPLEIFSLELREALDRIGEITGAVTTDEILCKIFNSFCIGK